MFLVGHAIVAFLIAYIICRIFKINQGVSFALAMVIGTIPDIDIVTQALGIMPHKAFTHSLILSAGIGSVIFLTARFGFKQAPAIAMIYALAYLQHLMDDIIIGTLNILYPIGNLPIGIGISYGSLTHEVIEFLLLAVAAAVIISTSFRASNDRILMLKEDHDGDVSSLVSLFRFSSIDKISYVLLILSLLFSFGYLLYGIKSLSRLIIDTQLEIALFVLLHISAVALVSFLMLVARHYASSEWSLVTTKRHYGHRR